MHITATERTNWNSAYNNLTDWFYKDSNGNIHAKYNLIGDKEVSAYGSGNTSGNTSGAITIVDNLTSTLTDAALSANQGRVLKNLIDAIDVGDLNLSDYSKTSHTHSNYSLTSHTHTQYASSSHTHPISAVTNLQSTLDGKSSTSHTHSNYSLTSHTHNNYSLTSHTHSNYSPTSHTHSYLPLSGGTMTGDLTFDYATSGGAQMIFKNGRAVANGGGWADNIINAQNSSGTRIGGLGMYGGGDVLTYFYIGHSSSYDGDNLRIYSDKVQFGDKVILHSGNYSSYTPTLTAYNTHTSNTTAHITATERTNWNKAYTNNHTHSNKSVLDGITSGKVSNWDAVYSNWNKVFEIDSSNNLKVKVNLIGEGEVSAYGSGSSSSSGAITIVDNLTSTLTDAALSANQGRVLKSLIDNIDVSNLNLSDYSKTSHTHSNYSLTSHTHSYLPLSGGTVDGSINTDAIASNRFGFNSKYTKQPTSVGWYRFAVGTTTNGTAGTYIFSIRRVYNNVNNEAYLIAVTLDYSSVAFTQLAGHHHSTSQLITKIRCTRTNSSTVYFDFYYNSTSSNAIYVNAIGHATLQTPTLVTDTLTYTDEFVLEQGVKSNLGFVGNLTGTASKATADANGDVISSTYSKTSHTHSNYSLTSHTHSNYSPTSHTHSYLPLSGGTVNGNVIVSGGSAASSFTIRRSPSVIAFQNSSGTLLGYLGFSAGNTPCMYTSSSTVNTLLHTGNSAHTHTFTSLTSKPTTISGYGITDAVPIYAYSYTSGYLVKTNITANSSKMVTFRIEGNSYGGSTRGVLTIGNFYDYADSSTAMLNPGATHYGYDIGDIKVFNYGGLVYLWFKQPSTFMTFFVTVYCGDGTNRVTSITNAAMPTSGVTKSTTITPNQISLNTHTHNYAGSSSAGGAATSANKVNSTLTFTTGTTTTGTFNGSAATTIKIPSSTSHITNDSGYITTSATVSNATKFGGLELRGDSAFKNSAIDAMVMYTISATSLSTSTFYPLMFPASAKELKVRMYSQTGSASATYNCNYIEFSFAGMGWSDVPSNLTVERYNCYTASETTIGCIAMGQEGGMKCIWIRGGLTYYVTSNIKPTLYSGGCTNGNEKFVTGSALSGGTNTKVTVYWTPQTTSGLGTMYHNGGIALGGGLTVASNTNLKGTLAVTGTSTFTGAATFNGGLSSTAVTTRGVTFNSANSASLSSSGWYRFATSNAANNYGGTYIFFIRRSYSNTNNESYIIACNTHQGVVTWKQLCGSYNTQLITNVRCTYTNGSTMYFDLQYTGTVANTVYVSCIGTCTLQVPTKTTSTLTTTSTFPLAQYAMGDAYAYIRGRVDNPLLYLKHTYNSTDYTYYVQAYNGQLMLGAGSAKSIKIDGTGNLIGIAEITAHSDRRLKTNIKPLIVRGELNPVTYVKDGKDSIGFIAQDVQELYPELVTVDESTDEKYLSLNYQQLTAVLAAQINELKREIEKLKNKIKS